MTGRDRTEVSAEGPERSVLLRFQRATAVGSAGAASIALAGLLAYVPGMEALGSIRPDYIPMAPSTAGCFLILSVALFGHDRKRWTQSDCKAAAVLVMLVAIFGLLELIGSLAGLDITGEDWLTSGAGTLGGIAVARMSPATALLFVIAAPGTLLLCLRWWGVGQAASLEHMASSLGVVTVLLGGTVLLGYLFGTPLMYTGGTVPMAATTAIAFLCLGAALAAAAGPTSFPIRLVVGDSLSAGLSRAFLPLTAASLLVQGILSQWVLRSVYAKHALLTSALIIVTCVITAFVVAGVSHRFGARLEESTRKLRSSEERHRTLLHTAMDGFWCADAEGRLLEVNETYARLSGYSIQELLAMGVTDLEAPESAEDTGAHMQEVMVQGQGRFESRHRRKDGSTFEVEVSIQWRPAEGGQFVAFVQDVSARKQADEARLSLEQRLLKAQKLESIGRLAGGVAHDFNNMLGVILGYVELALQQADPAQPIYADLLEIQNAARRSADLTRQLLTYASKQTVAPEVLDLNETVPELLSMLHRLLGEDIRLLWEPAAGLWPTTLDPSQFANLLTNLCLNARDAMVHGGTITLGTTNCSVDADDCAAHADALPGDYVRLTVSDTGGGMDGETMALIFEPFFTTKGVGEGTGLGLASVYGAVRQNHGFVTVSSSLGQGTKFEIYFSRQSVPLA